MTDSAANWMAIIFGVAVFALIVVTGWRSVQNRRIVRLHDADGHETIILAHEGDKVTSVATTTAQSHPSTPVAPTTPENGEGTDPQPSPASGANAANPERAV